MIHVATVHWRSERWIDPQLHYLERFMPSPFRVYAFLAEVPGDHRGRFFYSSTEPVKDHATKLDLLGELIQFAAEDPSDILVFADGDAFPVAPIGALVQERLERHKLIAVQRYENCGDLQPHPCFCVTTVGFWREIGGDWHRGAKWVDSRGVRVTDVGGNLLAALERAEVDWYPLRRVNSLDAHPLWFGLYGDAAHGPLVYHHGAGFRPSPGGRESVYARKEAKASSWARGAKMVPKVGPLRGVRRRLNPSINLRERQIEETRELSDELFAEIERDEEFWRRFA
jgi:hypothetical protein